MGDATISTAIFARFFQLTDGDHDQQFSTNETPLVPRSLFTMLDSVDGRHGNGFTIQDAENYLKKNGLAKIGAAFPHLVITYDSAAQCLRADPKMSDPLPGPPIPPTDKRIAPLLQQAGITADYLATFKGEVLAGRQRKGRPLLILMPELHQIGIFELVTATMVETVRRAIGKTLFAYEGVGMRSRYDQSAARESWDLYRGYFEFLQKNPDDADTLIAAVSPQMGRLIRKLSSLRPHFVQADGSYPDYTGLRRTIAAASSAKQVQMLSALATIDVRLALALHYPDEISYSLEAKQGVLLGDSTGPNPKTDNPIADRITAIQDRLQTFIRRRLNPSTCDYSFLLTESGQEAAKGLADGDTVVIEDRDKKWVRNLRAVMKKTGAKAAVLEIGQAHVPHLLGLLKDYSYLVIAPSMP